MKNVVMIAYGFPPEGSAGAYRPLRFCRHLPTMGWRASVVSVAKDHYERYDPGLGKLVPHDTEVIRVRGEDLWQAYQAKRNKRLDERLTTASVATLAQIHRAQKMPLRSLAREVLRTVETWWYHPDIAAPWIQQAVEETVKLCRRIGASVIWATAPPVSSLCVAQRASERVGLPYVLDFRDPLTFVPNDFEARRPKWAIRNDRGRMYRLLQGARAVIFRHAADAECYWRAYPKALEVERIHLIPNGYEGKIEEFTAPDTERCTILYSGTLTGAPYRYDTVLQSLNFLKQTDPTRAKRLRLLFVGDDSQILKEQADSLNISEMVEFSGPVPQDEVARLGRDAHALLVLGLAPTLRGYELLVASKLFGYFKAGRPIIGVLPQDETKNFLKRVGVTTIADVDSVSEITSILCKLLDHWSRGTLSSLIPDAKACMAFSAEAQTAALICALEGKSAHDPFIPGEVEIPPSLRAHIGKEGWIS
jgi:glycosyltransferase involved in cell wall biosynthesis